MGDTQKVGGIDRRWVYLLVAVGALIPILFPMGLSVQTTPPVEQLFDVIENSGPDDVVLVSYDYGPSSAPELDPMADAIMRHCFSREIRVALMSLFPLGGPNMVLESMDRVTDEFDVVEGEDYVYLGYKDGAQAVMRRMAENMATAFPQDHRGVDYLEVPMLQSITNYSDITLVVSLATGTIGEWWASLVNAQFGQLVGVGATAVSAPKYYAYLKAGQMVGLLGGLKGAAEYETLLGESYPDLKERSNQAVRGMDVQSIVHLIIVAFILLGNVVYFVSRKERGRSGGKLVSD